MPVDLYYILPSNPCRAVMMLAKAIGLELNLKQCNILAGENRTPEYLKLNPQHTVPVMVDNGLIITESRAILSYFVNQYAKNDSLYPKDPKIRAMVDQSLYFDMGTLNARTQAYYNAVIFGAVQTPENLQKVHEAVGWLNTMLEGRQFAAGDQLTIADFALGVTVTNLDVFGFDINSYPNMIAWYARIKAAMAPYGYEEINQAGADMLAGMYRGKLAQS